MELLWMDEVIPVRYTSWLRCRRCFFQHVSTGRVISLILQTGRRRLPQQELATHQ
jgi:hypothetical protein